MTTTLNATTSNGLVVTPDNSGNVVLQYNGVAAPAFQAFIGTQSISADTSSLMTFSNEVYDTASCFNNTGSTVGGIPAYSFLPTVAGYYQVNLSCYWRSYPATGFVGMTLFKNGSGYLEVARINTATGTFSGSCIVYLNGTTDYVNGYFYAANNSGTVIADNNGASFSNFSGCLLRGA
jgi:hypothetical protein